MSKAKHLKVSRRCEVFYVYIFRPTAVGLQERERRDRRVQEFMLCEPERGSRYTVFWFSLHCDRYRLTELHAQTTPLIVVRDHLVPRRLAPQAACSIITISVSHHSVSSLLWLEVCLHMQRINALMLMHTLTTRAVGPLYGLATLTFHRTTLLCFALRPQTFIAFSTPRARVS